MNYYILATLSLLAIFVLSMLCRELFFYIMKLLRKKGRRDQLHTLVGINPRYGRKLLHQTVRGTLQRLSWSLFVANNEEAGEGVKQFAEIQGIDNSCDYVDTFQMAKLAKKNPVLYRRVYQKMGDGFEAFIRALEWSARQMHGMLYKLRRVLRSHSINRSQSAQRETIKFIHNSGGMNNDKTDKRT